MNTAIESRIKELCSSSDALQMPEGFEYRVQIIKNRGVGFVDGQNKVTMGANAVEVKRILSAYEGKDNSPEFKYAVRNAQQQFIELTQQVSDIDALLAFINEHTQEGRKLGQMLPVIWDRSKKKCQKLSKESSIVSYQPSVISPGKSNDDHAEERETVARRRIKKNSGDTRLSVSEEGGEKYLELRERKEILDQLDEELSSELPKLLRRLRKKHKVSLEPEINVASQYVQILQIKHDLQINKNLKMFICIIPIMLSVLVFQLCYNKYLSEQVGMLEKRVEVLKRKILKNEKRSLVEPQESFDIFSYMHIAQICLFCSIVWISSRMILKSFSQLYYMGENNDRSRSDSSNISLVIRSAMKSENDVVNDTFQKVKSLLECEESIQCIEKSKEIKEKMNEIKEINEELLNTTLPHTRTESANSISGRNAQHSNANQRWCSIM